MIKRKLGFLWFTPNFKSLSEGVGGKRETTKARRLGNRRNEKRRYLGTRGGGDLD